MRRFSHGSFLINGDRDAKGGEFHCDAVENISLLAVYFNFRQLPKLYSS